MRNYDLTVVLPGGMTAAKKKSTREKIEKMLGAMKAKVGKVDDWGEIELAYPIKKSTAGIFLHFHLELNAESVKTIADKLKLEKDIIRHLLVKKE